MSGEETGAGAGQWLLPRYDRVIGLQVWRRAIMIHIKRQAQLAAVTGAANWISRRHSLDNLAAFASWRGSSGTAVSWWVIADWMNGTT